MSLRRLAVVAAALVATAVVPASDGATHAKTIPFEGTVTLKAFDVTKQCAAKSVSSKLLRVRCAQLGTFAGEPAPANANFGWTWDLPVDSAGQTTGPATEHATLILNFGAPGLLYLSLAGKQRIVGTTTATRATAITKGMWAITKGTAAFVGRNGKGTYTFKAARTNSESVFSVAQVKLSGSIT